MSHIAGTGIIQGTGGRGSINIDVNVEQIVVNKHDNITIKADLQNMSTSEVAEGSRLYYTEDHVDANIALKTTTDIAEGESLYYTEDRVDANIALKTTTDIAEGTNLYYTENRVSANEYVVDFKKKIDCYTNDEGHFINGAITNISTVAEIVATNIDNYINTINTNARFS